jgi:predicted nucleic acid-binding protein
MSNGAYMAKIDKAVFDTGPFLHLHEVHALSSLDIIKEKNITHEIKKELKQYSVPLHKIKGVCTKQLSARYKNIAKIIIEAYEIDLGEATAIALAQQEQISLFFTDDLEGREVAKQFHLTVHGTLGILLRSFREKKISKKEPIILVKKLSRDSTLFLTSDLVAWTLKEIQAYN